MGTVKPKAYKNAQVSVECKDCDFSIKANLNKHTQDAPIVEIENPGTAITVVKDYFNYIYKNSLRHIKYTGHNLIFTLH